MRAFGGMVTIVLRTDLAGTKRFLERCRLFALAESLGGVESLASLPVLTSHWGHSDEQLRAAGVTKGMVRISVGLEDADDIIGDLVQALG